MERAPRETSGVIPADRDSLTGCWLLSGIAWALVPMRKFLVQRRGPCQGQSIARGAQGSGYTLLGIFA